MPRFLAVLPALALALAIAAPNADAAKGSQRRARAAAAAKKHQQAKPPAKTTKAGKLSRSRRAALKAKQKSALSESRVATADKPGKPTPAVTAKRSARGLKRVNTEAGGPEAAVLAKPTTVAAVVPEPLAKPVEVIPSPEPVTPTAKPARRSSARKPAARRTKVAGADGEVEAPETMIARVGQRGRTGGRGKKVPGATKREEMAMQTVSARLARRFPGRSFEVSTPVVEFVGDAANPITGRGPIEVRAVQHGSYPTGIGGKIAEAFQSQRDKTYVVLVENSGEARVLAEQSTNFLARTWRGLNRALPVRELIGDILRSEGVKKGLGLSALGLASAGTGAGSILGGGLIVGGLKMMTEGVQRRQVARKEALASTVTELKGRVGKGEKINFSEAYDIYRDALDKAKPGTTALDEIQFARTLRVSGL